MNRTDQLSRRSFLKLSALALASLSLGNLAAFPVEDGPTHPVGLGRVATNVVYIVNQPRPNATRIGQVKRDQIIEILDEVRSPFGPKRNPRWYDIGGGYVHCGHIQRVDAAAPTSARTTLPAEKMPASITVPFTQSMIYTRSKKWAPNYRLYYESTHWVDGIVEGPDGQPWYQIIDDRLRLHYCVPATHMQFLSPDDFAPISGHLGWNQKRIIVDKTNQKLTAYEGEGDTWTPVRQVSISSGVPNHPDLAEDEIPTDTPEGSFRISVKWPTCHMGDGYLTADPYAYELPGIPWTMFFHQDGYALHGCYWHDNFGYRMSHGCLNMRNADANWFFRWTDPQYTLDDFYVKGRGTLVIIKE